MVDVAIIGDDDKVKAKWPVLSLSAEVEALTRLGGFVHQIEASSGPMRR